MQDSSNEANSDRSSSSEGEFALSYLKKVRKREEELVNLLKHQQRIKRARYNRSTSKKEMAECFADAETQTPSNGMSIHSFNTEEVKRLVVQEAEDRARKSSEAALKEIEEKSEKARKQISDMEVCLSVVKEDFDVLSKEELALQEEAAALEEHLAQRADKEREALLARAAEARRAIDSLVCP